jgi:hypothetical protein
MHGRCETFGPSKDVVKLFQGDPEKFGKVRPLPRLRRLRTTFPTADGAAICAKLLSERLLGVASG